jgi:hypothetical protein
VFGQAQFDFGPPSRQLAKSTSFDRYPIHWGAADIRISMRLTWPALPRLWSFDHGADALRVEGLAAFIAIACIFQPGADFSVAQAAGLALRPPKATRFGNHLRPQLSMRFPATDLFAGLLALAFSGATQLGDQAPLFVLHEGAGDLAHHYAAQVVAVGQIIARSRKQANAALGQQRDAQFLHDQVTRETASVLDENCGDTVASRAKPSRPSIGSAPLTAAS